MGHMASGGTKATQEPDARRTGRRRPGGAARRGNAGAGLGAAVAVYGMRRAGCCLRRDRRAALIGSAKRSARPCVQGDGSSGTPSAFS